MSAALTLCERFPVVESTHELLAVEGCTLLRSGLGRASSAHLHDRDGTSDRQVRCTPPRVELASYHPRYGTQPSPLEEQGRSPPLWVKGNRSLQREARATAAYTHTHTSTHTHTHTDTHMQFQCYWQPLAELGTCGNNDFFWKWLLT